jgi:excisionase family DNA binding protein
MAKAKDSATMLSVESAAKQLGIGRQTAYEGIRRGEIPSVKICGRILVPRAALARLEGNA